MTVITSAQADELADALGVTKDDLDQCLAQVGIKIQSLTVEPSPRPWRLTEDVMRGEISGCRDILDSAGNEILYTCGLSNDEQDMANALLVIQAVNGASK